MKLKEVVKNPSEFAKFEWSQRIYDGQTVTPQDVKQSFLPALKRVKALQQYLSQVFVGDHMKRNIRMLLAAAIAQEPTLFVGGPGLAKTELAVAFFESIGLRKPVSDAETEEENKYYEYLLSAFTVPEELFGPYRIDLLKAGKFVRNNTNMLTGKGVRACFLDEVFKGSSNILNTLLTLINERRYFNDGAFQQSDLRIILGAANTTPANASSSFSGKIELPGKSGNELMAFYDRFTVRLYFEPPETAQVNEISASDFFRIREKSIEREAFKLRHARPFQFSPDAQPCLNDFLLLSRALFLHLAGEEVGILQQPSERWVELFLRMGMNLAREESSMVRISPRKMTRLEKLAYALALVDHLDHVPKATIKDKVMVENRHCEVFSYAWESEFLRPQLVRQVEQQIGAGLE